MRGLFLTLRRDDAGSSMVMVMGSLIVTALMVFAVLAYALQNAAPTRRDQDAKTAVAAAQAGIDEYVSRLTANDSYWMGGNGDATNTAFTSGQVIQGTNGSGAHYQYEVLSTAASTAQDGVIRLKVTGTSSPSSGQDPVSRTLIATLKVSGFLNYVYLSDIEVVDPSIVGGSGACATYYYTGRSGMGGCAEIQWTGGDTVRGPLHSNDALQINGNVNFTDPRTESSWPTLNGTSNPKTWWGTQSPPLTGNSPVYAAPLALPVGNTTLLQYVAPDVDGSSSTPVGDGCYYQGATEIVFTGTSMQVRSPMTARADTPSRCLNVANRANWQVISPIPPVIYVDTATTGTCTTGNTAAFSYPRAGESYTTGSSTAVSWGTRINYNCRRGSAYVQGTVSDQVTVSAVDDIVITGNLQVGSLTGTDVIGLVGGNCVWIYHPINGGGNNIGTTATTVQAAILALRHSFVVENWSSGSPLGTLNVTGAIAQKFRGPVGTGTATSIATGYYKNYVYDSRLQNLQPPYFLKPTSTPWEVSSLVDG